MFVTSNDPVIGGGNKGYMKGSSEITATRACRARSIFRSAKRWLRASLSTAKNGAASGTSRGPTRDAMRACARGARGWAFSGSPSDALTVLFKTDYSHLDIGAYPADPVNFAERPVPGDRQRRSEGGGRAHSMGAECRLYGFQTASRCGGSAAIRAAGRTIRADLDGTSVGTRLSAMWWTRGSFRRN